MFSLSLHVPGVRCVFSFFFFFFVLPEFLLLLFLFFWARFITCIIPDRLFIVVRHTNWEEGRIVRSLSLFYFIFFSPFHLFPFGCCGLHLSSCCCRSVQPNDQCKANPYSPSAELQTKRWEIREAKAKAFISLSRHQIAPASVLYLVISSKALLLPRLVVVQHPPSIYLALFYDPCASALY